MALDNIQHQETPEVLQEIIRDLNQLKNEVLKNGDKDENGKDFGVETEENGNEKINTEERIDVNPEILKEEMRKDLKIIPLMSSEEIKAELRSYGVTIPEGFEDKKEELENLLNGARNTIANEDKNSDIIDFHIGTYTQGRNMCCSVLAQLDTMSDNEIKDMIQIKKDSDNKLSYYVTFPQDKGNNDATVKITEEELNLGTLTINEYGQDRILDNLPKGDKDVTLIIMAFIKRFGAKFVDDGEWAYKAQNKFRTPTEPKLKDNQYFEDIQDYSNLPLHSMINFLDPNEIRRKGIDFRPRTEEEVSWIKDKSIKMEAIEKKDKSKKLEDKELENKEPEDKKLEDNTGVGAAIMTLSNGKKACITKTRMYISDGTIIPAGHAMSFRGYDEKTEELIISGSEYNNISEVRIPKELFIFLETASLEGTPGVDKTPEPTE